MVAIAPLVTSGMWLLCFSGMKGQPLLGCSQVADKCEKAVFV